MNTLGNVRVCWWRHESFGPFGIRRYNYRRSDAGHTTWTRVGPLDLRWWRR